MVETTKKDEANPPVEEESPGQKVKRNWADVDDEGDDDGVQKDIGGSGPIAQAPKEAENQAPKIVVPKVKREKNAFGDFVVTKINIREKEVPKTVAPLEEESEEEEDSEPESDKNEQEEEKSK